MSYKLDKFQNEAVKAKSRNTLIVAAPGSGKTTVIINRVKHLLEELKVNSNNIFVITFTKAAANNMKDRFSRDNSNLKAPFFGTFHGLFYKLLMRHLGSINIISTSESYKIVENTLKVYIDEISEDKVKEMLNEISRFKTSLGEYKIDDIITNKCIENYEGYKMEKNLMDFDDLQIEMYKLLSEDKKVLEYYSNGLKYILVDEFQDCDLIQLKILKLLNSSNSLFCVGDEDQCIYGFRGSRPECMVNFKEEFGGEKVYLSYNYRSVSNIVKLSKNLIKNNLERNPKEIINYRGEEGNINISKPYNEKFQGEDIVNSIVKKNGQGIPLNNNVILYRTNIESRSISDELIARKIPFRFLDKEYNFFEHFICKDILAYLKLSIDPYDREAFKRIINKPFRYISKNNIESLSKLRERRNVFDDLIINGDFKSFQLNNLERLKKDISYLNKLSLPSAVDTVLNDLEYREYLREYGEKFRVASDDFERIIEEFRTIVLDFKSITTLLVHVEEVKEKLSNKERDFKEDGVLLSTIHGVKGMEFENVYILNCCEEVIPHANATDIEEERRLFYVAITRAINNLNIYAPKTLRGRFTETSPFIKELEFKGEPEEKSKLNKGDKIFHKSHGEGEIVSLKDDVVEIEFEDGVKRKFSLSILFLNRLIEVKE
ncbi:ATP-dependent helicase [Clostridium sp. 'White wine YQ']|nr:ATP-dependent helicase [Clostridium sp. 'White wine YQ']MDD7792995.1 ATP-dependent helicase [Clostridium sp. 'White wine YQ']